MKSWGGRSPDCEDKTYEWAAEGNAPVSGAFHACLRRNPLPDGSERVEVKIKSNRSVAQWLVMPDHPHDYLWIEGGPDWDRVGPLITELDQALDPIDCSLRRDGRSQLGTFAHRAKVHALSFGATRRLPRRWCRLRSSMSENLGTVGATMLLTWCMLDESEATGRDVRIVDLGVRKIVDCIQDASIELAGVGADGLLSRLRTMYDAAVREGRFLLSAGAADGVMALVDKASRLERGPIQALSTFGKALSGLTAAELLAGLCDHGAGPGDRVCAQ